jgi:hypothetical protein
MKHAVDTGACATIYIEFHIDWFRQSETNGGENTQTARRLHKPTSVHPVKFAFLTAVR